MKIAIVGGSGFIGTRLTSRLVDAGHEVVIIDIVQSLKFCHLWQYGDVRRIDTLLAGMKGCEIIYNLAAEHRDDVAPFSLYYEINVEGARNICRAAEELDIHRIVFTSSVAVYGSSQIERDETGPLNPSNHYGSSKMLAEEVYRTWEGESRERSLVIVRPTVVFGEENRGNVYNLLKQIAGNKFLMIGKGTNLKSMAYVENVAAFLEYVIIFQKGINIFNYTDKPDFDMNQLIRTLKGIMGRKEKIRFRIPYPVGLIGGFLFDFLSILSRKKMPISSIRVKKFTQNTLFSSARMNELYFIPPVDIQEGLKTTIQHEFLCREK